MNRRIVAALVLATVVVAVSVAASVVLRRAQTPAVAAGPPTFVDETAASGLVQHNDGGDLFQVGGGVAVFDCDGDRRPDVYVAGGEQAATLFRNASPTGGALRFETVDSPVAMDAVDGAYPIDVDGDGQDDLVVLRAGTSVIFRNSGDCSFDSANDALGFAGAPGHAMAFSATWEADAALPTLAFGNYLKLDPNGERTSECDVSALIRPAATGATYAEPIVLSPGYCALSMLFSDWDGSGRRDLRVSNDREWYGNEGMEQLWRIEPGVAPRIYDADDGWVAIRIFGMGIASQDLTGDGLPEIYLTSQDDNKLQTLTAGPAHPAYRDIALRRGVTATKPFTGDTHLGSTAWHPEFADVNNDGFVDLFVSKGNVGAQAGYAMKDPSNLFLGQPDGTFVEAADRAGILNFERGRGAALVDFNLDGLLDLIEVNYLADAVVWRNVGSGSPDAPTMGHWLEVAIEQPSPNPDAIGGWLEVKIGDAMLRRELTIGGGHAGGQLGWQHVGLGPATSAEVRVRWPDGTIGPWLKMEADRFGIIRRGADRIEPWSPSE